MWFISRAIKNHKLASRRIIWTDQDQSCDETKQLPMKNN